MSYDEPDRRPADEPDGRQPEQATPSYTPGEPPPYVPPYGRPYDPNYPTAPLPQPGQPGYGGYPQSPPRQQTSQGRVPGWIWPLVAATALVVGLFGGTIGGVLVSRSMNDSGGPIQVLSPENGAEPLRADNGSVAAVAAKLLPSTVQVNANGGSDGAGGGGATGSGFVVDKQGRVITNNHVVADATEDGALQIVDQDGKSYDATIIGRSPVYDLAVLDVKGGDALPPVSIGSSRAMRVGDTVVAIGSPLGLSSTVTSGIVSALDRPVTTSGGSESSFIDAVQTDAAINPGNSGGPLVNMRGQVVGVNSAIATTGGSFGGSSGNIGVGFAIPMEQVQLTSAQILQTGEARYPVIGANVNTTDAKVVGAEVVKVPPGTPASRAGLQEGDIVVSVNNQPVTDGIELIVAIRAHQPGDTITLGIERDGETEEVEVTLDSKVG